MLLLQMEEHRVMLMVGFGPLWTDTVAALFLNVGWDRIGAQFAVTRGVAANGAREEVIS